jgi:dTDP-4-dehydrorhamnose reductase
MKTVLILGGDGMLGNALVRYGSRLSQVHIVATSRRPHTDLLHFEVTADASGNLEKLIEQVQPHYIVNCIGVIRPKAGLDELQRSILVNSYFPQAVALLCSSHGIRMIHVSTDCVFRGAAGSYRETDVPDELDMYGLTKFLGEVRQHPHVTLRTSIIGRELETKRNLVEWFLDAAGSGAAVRGFSAVYWNGVTTLTLAKIIFRIVECDLLRDEALVQLASERVAKYDLLRMLNESYELGANIIEDDGPKSDKTLMASRAQAEHFQDLIPSLAAQIDELRKIYE